eukprot:TRINITY_DN697_c0_g1_i1.p1 TRINITY_DN697_c0_g1~~TRINITY_DN697_c0_g1_i1.p1  ORF type:complete len:382 (-),score=96.74 TRINITY_DN697_c0_g1_i1:7-1152(-)
MQRWWRERKEDLLALGAQTPLYVYNEETIINTVAGLKGLTSIDVLFFAIKANPCPAILKLLHAEGFGFECVSPGEIKHILDLFPDISHDKILFTPNFVTKAEYEYALSLDIHVTLDSLYPLNAWGDVFKGKEVAVRFDPLIREGHHEYVKTAGKESKFGLSMDDIKILPELAKNVGVKIVGFHSHVGSGILASETWRKVADFLIQFLPQFPDTKFFDLGGGLGVVDREGKQPLDLNVLNKGLLEWKSEHPNIKLWLEPGRYVVAESGVLLTSVTQWKTKGDVFYVGVDTGFNTLIRPILYQAWHEIVNLSKDGDASREEVVTDVVGNICETGDVLGHDRKIKKPDEGDVFLIDITGAYGRSMSSNYNLREPAKEHLLERRK